MSEKKRNLINFLGGIYIPFYDLGHRVWEVADYLSFSKQTIAQQSLHDRHTSDTVCPRCGSALVERTVKQGPRTGTQFVGCSGYPKCRFTLN